jgi:hypothetical protein
VVGTPVVPGAANVPYLTMPLDKSSFQPEDKPTWLVDKGIRGSQADTFNVIQGVETASWSAGGPFYADAHGFILDNLFGDSTASNTAVTSNTTATAPVAAGATTLTLTALGTFVTGGYMQIGNAAITSPGVEIVGPITMAGSVASWVNPTRFAHSSATPAVAFLSAASAAATLTAHKFSALNSGNGQPPTHTFLDYTGLGIGAGNTFGARVYAYSCVAQLDLTFSAQQLLTAKIGSTSLLSAVSATQPVNTPSAVVPVPAWRGTAMLNTGSGYVAVTDFGEVTYSLKRMLQVYHDLNGSQAPFAIARGPVSVTGMIKYAPSVDESALTNMLVNNQPGLQLTCTDAATNSLVVQTTKTAYTAARPNRSDVLMGYDVTFETVANTTDAGFSGGLSPVLVSLSNFFPAY